MLTCFAKCSRNRRTPRLLDGVQQTGARQSVRGLSCLAVFLSMVLSASSARAAWPSLTEVWQRAKIAAPEVVRARSAVLVAQSAGAGARISSFHNPYLEIYVDRAVSQPATGVAVSGVLFLPFDINGQRSARIAEANALLSWQKLSQVEAESQVLGASVIAYGGAVVAAVRLAQAEIAERQAEAEVEYFRGRAAAGDATLVDRATAEAEVARYSQLRAEAGIALVRARQQVAMLTGVPEVEAPPPNVPTNPPALRATEISAQAQAVVERSPFLKSLESETLFYERQRERAERVTAPPPLSAILTAGRSELRRHPRGGGLGWTFPVLRRNQGEIARAVAEEGAPTQSAPRCRWCSDHACGPTQKNIARHSRR